MRLATRHTFLSALSPPCLKTSVKGTGLSGTVQHAARRWTNQHLQADRPSAAKGAQREPAQMWAQLRRRSSVKGNNRTALQLGSKWNSQARVGGSLGGGGSLCKVGWKEAVVLGVAGEVIMGATRLLTMAGVLLTGCGRHPEGNMGTPKNSICSVV